MIHIQNVVQVKSLWLADIIDSRESVFNKDLKLISSAYLKLKCSFIALNLLFNIRV